MPVGTHPSGMYFLLMIKKTKRVNTKAWGLFCRFVFLFYIWCNFNTGTAATARPLYAIAVSTFSNSRKFLKQKVHQGLCNWLVKIEWKFYLRKSFSIGIVKARFQTTDIVKTTWQSFFFSTTFSITKSCYKVLVSFCPFYFNTKSTASILRLKQ